MQNANLKVKNPFHPQFLETHLAAPKSLQSEKALGGTENQELANWYEDAVSYYNSVISGQIQAPADYDVNTAYEHILWASQQLSGTSGNIPQSGFLQDGFQDPLDGGDMGGSFQSAPEGAYRGPNGSYIYDLEDADIFYTKDSTPIHSWALNNDVHVPSMGTLVQMVLVNDEETGGRQILKVLLKDRYGTETVMTFDNWDHPDFNLQLHMANTENVEISDELKDKISVEKYKSPQATAEESQVVMNGEAVAGEAIDGMENGYYFEAPTNQDVFDIRPQAGEDEVFEILGNANISVPLSSEVKVKGSDNPEYDYVLEVTHKDGSTDIIYVRDEFQTNINAVGEYIQFDSTEFGDMEAGEVPSDLKGVFSINGGVDASGNSILNPDDTVPDKTGKVNSGSPIGGSEYAEYTSQESVSLTANFEDDVDVHMIYGRYAEINVSSFKDKVEVTKLGKDYLIIVSNNGKKERFWVDGGIEEIFINGTSVELTGDAIGDEKLRGPGVEAGAVSEGEEGLARKDILANFMAILGLNTKSQILNAVKTEFPELNTIEKLEQAILEGTFPPANPGAAELQKVIKVLYILDGDFSGALDAANKWDGATLRDAYKEATPRVVELLKTLYPLSNIKMKNPKSDSWVALNEIEFDGTLYNIFNQKESDKNPDEILVWETVGSKAHNHNDDNA